MSDRTVYVDPFPGEAADKLVFVPCDRCGGSGFLAHFNHIDGGICYGCEGGKGQMVTVRTLRQRASSAASAARKAEAKTTERLARHDEAIAQVAKLTDNWSKWLELANDKGGSFLFDIWMKAFDYDLSEKQVAAVASSIDKKLSWKAEAEAKRSALTPAPVGKVEVAGTVLKTTYKEGDWGPVYKMTVLADEGFEVYSTIPKKIIDTFEAEYDEDTNVYAVIEALVGRQVAFTATLSPSQDAGFAFASSPSKASLAARS